MSATSIGTYSADTLQSLGAISNNESALARVAKYLRKVVKEFPKLILAKNDNKRSS